MIVSLILGNLRFFRYPALVMAGPFIAAAALGAIVWEARRKGGTDAGRQFNETSSGVDADAEIPGAAGERPEGLVATPLSDSGGEWPAGYVTEPVTHASASVLGPPPPPDDDPSAQLLQAWAEVHDPNTTSARLADIVGRYPEFGPAVLVHPNCYPELATWIQELGLPEATPIDTLYRPSFVEATDETQLRVERTGLVPRALEPHSAGTALAPPPLRPSKRSPRWVMPVVGGSAAVLVLGLIFMLTPRGAATTTAATPATRSTVTTPSATPALPGDESSDEPEPSLDPPSAASEPAGPAFICWDGRGASQADDCAPPKGRAGVRYIYPSLATQWDRCSYMDYRPTTAAYDCSLAGGVIRYRYWSDTAEARRHYEGKYAHADQSDLVLDGEAMGTIYRATTPVKGVLTMTAWWGNGHYSLSVEASRRAVREELWKRVVFRAPADLNGHRAGVAPRNAVVG